MLFSLWIDAKCVMEEEKYDSLFEGMQAANETLGNNHPKKDCKVMVVVKDGPKQIQFIKDGDTWSIHYLGKA